MQESGTLNGWNAHIRSSTEMTDDFRRMNASLGCSSAVYSERGGPGRLGVFPLGWWPECAENVSTTQRVPFCEVIIRYQQFKQAGPGPAITAIS
jgi:hypothetical protein